MTHLLSYLIRQGHTGSDTFYLLLSITLGCFFGGVMGLKISMSAGLAIGLFSTLVLYFMWRAPDSSASISL
ncbi:hypothetical protein D3C87_2085430 [compost metagenome]